MQSGMRAPLLPWLFSIATALGAMQAPMSQKRHGWPCLVHAGHQHASPSHIPGGHAAAVEVSEAHLSSSLVDCLYSIGWLCIGDG